MGDVLPRLLFEDIGNIGIQETELIVALKDADRIKVIREVENALIPNCPDPSTRLYKHSRQRSDKEFIPISIVSF